MAKLIIVHEWSKGNEILINTDQIIEARENHTSSGNYTAVSLVGDKSRSIKETIQQLVVMGA
jgi:hypothetical protein